MNELIRLPLPINENDVIDGEIVGPEVLPPEWRRADRNARGAMPGKWRKMYFEQIGAAQDAGIAGVSTIQRLSPMTFVASDIADAVAWSFISGFGVSLLHGALTRLSSLEDTLVYSIGTIGFALLAPVLKDGTVGFVCDIAELWERRHSVEIEPESEPRLPIIVRTQTTSGGGTWKFYSPPIRKSKEPIPIRDIRAVARRLVADNFRGFTLGNIVTDLRLMSDPDFRLFQQDLERRRWATKLPGNKVVIEPVGRAMLLKMANS